MDAYQPLNNSQRCPTCGIEISPTDVFCPQCGAKLSKAEDSLSKGKKIKIYLITFFLAPFGLIYFFKYFRSEDAAKRSLAYRVLVITLLVIVFTIISSVYIVNFYSEYMRGAGVNLQLYGL